MHVVKNHSCPLSIFFFIIVCILNIVYILKLLFDYLKQNILISKFLIEKNILIDNMTLLRQGAKVVVSVERMKKDLYRGRSFLMKTDLS